MERILVLDLFGVFLRFCPMAHGESVFAKCSAPRGRVRDFFDGPSPAWDGYERGLIGDAGFTAALQNELGYKGTIEDFGERFFRSVSLDAKFYDFFQEIRHNEQGWRFQLLTNICPVFYRLARQRHPGIFSSVEKSTLSFEVGLRKPDPRIFAEVIAGKQEDDIYVFVDDTEENAVAAEKAGIGSIHFRQGMLESGGLRQRLVKFGMANI